MKRSLKSMKRKRLMMGYAVDEFEKRLGEFLGVDPSLIIASNSGSSALLVAIKVLNPLKVAVPIYTCAAVSQAAYLAGKQVEFEDNYSTENFFSKSANPNSDSLRILVHTFGVPHPDLSQSTGVIEDCAQAIGAKLNGKSLGLIGEAGTYSFSATKLITTAGAGGATIFRNEEMANYARDILDYDSPRNPKTKFNLKMTDVAAEFGIAQLSRINQFIQKREEIFEIYRNAGLPLLAADLPDEVSPVRYRAIIKVETPSAVIEKLRTYGIGCIYPIHQSEFVCNPDMFPNAQKFSQNHISLPIFPDLSFRSAKKIAKLVGSML